VDTLVDARAERRRRRRHGPQCKSEVIASFRQRGLSIAAVALDNGLNAPRNTASELPGQAGTAMVDRKGPMDLLLAPENEVGWNEGRRRIWSRR
jgi:hypothetical protein